MRIADCGIEEQRAESRRQEADGRRTCEGRRAKGEAVSTKGRAEFGFRILRAKGKEVRAKRKSGRPEIRRERGERRKR